MIYVNYQKNVPCHTSKDKIIVPRHVCRCSCFRCNVVVFNYVIRFCLSFLMIFLSFSLSLIWFHVNLTFQRRKKPCFQRIVTSQNRSGFLYFVCVCRQWSCCLTQLHAHWSVRCVSSSPWFRSVSDSLEYLRWNEKKTHILLTLLFSVRHLKRWTSMHCSTRSHDSFRVSVYLLHMKQLRI